MTKTVEQQAKDISLVHPMNIYPSAIGTILFMYAAVEFSIITVLVGGVFFALGLGSLVANRYVRTNHFIEVALKSDHENRSKAIRKRVKTIGDDLHHFEQTDAQNQLKNLVKKVDTFNDILINRFDGQGLAFSRFLGVSDTIYSNALKAYEEMILLLKQSSGINAEHCRSQIAEMRDDATKSSQVRTLTTRLKLKTELTQKVDTMLLSNEEAITKLDVTMSSFADLSTEHEIEWAMKELQSLSDVLKPNQNGELL